MALSGNFIKNPVNGSNFGLYCTWTGEQSATGNYTEITLNTYLRVYNVNVGTRSASTTIDGKATSYTAHSLLRQNAGSWTDLLLNTRKERVSHNTDGTKDVTLSSYYASNITYSGVYVASITASDTFSLKKIDRSAPTVSFQTSDITGSSVKIMATSSVQANQWQYSTNNGGTWVTFSSSSGTTASGTITGLAQAQTYTIKVRARKASNNVYGTSSAKNVTTLGNSVLNSVNPVTIDTASVSLEYAWTIYDASYSHTLSLSYGNTVFFTMNDVVSAKGTSNRSLNITDYKSELLSATESSKSISATLTLHTYDADGEQVGKPSLKSVTLQTSSLSAPAFNNASGITIKDSNTATVAVTGDANMIVQDRSNISVTGYSATAKNGAKIARYEVSANGVTKTSTNTGGITWGSPLYSGIITLTVTAIDSRGYSVSHQVDVDVIEYSDIEIDSWSIERINSVESTARLKLSGKLSQVEGHNAEIELQYRYKLTGTSSYESWKTLTATVTGSTFSFAGALSDTFDSDYSYDVEIQVKDAFTDDSEVLTLPLGIPLVAYRSKRVGINNANPKAGLDVVGGLIIDGKQVPTVEYGTWTPSILLGDWIYTEQTGIWARVGDLVHISVIIRTARGTVHRNGIIVSVPFAPASGKQCYFAGISDVKSEYMGHGRYFRIDPEGSSWVRCGIEMSETWDTLVTHYLDTAGASIEFSGWYCIA